MSLLSVLLNIMRKLFLAIKSIYYLVQLLTIGSIVMDGEMLNITSKKMEGIDSYEVQMIFEPSNCKIAKKIFRTF